MPDHAELADLEAAIRDVFDRYAVVASSSLFAAVHADGKVLTRTSSYKDARAIRNDMVVRDLLELIIDRETRKPAP